MVHVKEVLHDMHNKQYSSILVTYSNHTYYTYEVHKYMYMYQI